MKYMFQRKNLLNLEFPMLTSRRMKFISCIIVIKAQVSLFHEQQYLKCSSQFQKGANRQPVAKTYP